MKTQTKTRVALTVAGGLSAMVAAAVPAAAQAQDRAEVESGPYITGRIGIALPSDFDLEGVQAPQAPSPGAPGAPANVNTQLGNEVTFSGAVGYKLPARLFNLFEPSIELEYTNTSPDVSGGSFNGGNQSFDGNVKVETYTLNYQPDIVWKDDQRIIPFIGGGIGIAAVDSNVTYFPPTATAPTFGVIGEDEAFVYQSNAGLRFKINDQFSIDGRVRYQRVDGVDLERRFIAGGNDAFNADVSGDYETVNFLAGVRFSF